MTTPKRRTLEEIENRIATEMVYWLEHHELGTSLSTEGQRIVKEAFRDALREAADAARQEEFERLYQKIVNRISADIAGGFDAGLDQLEYNVRQEEREALRIYLRSMDHPADAALAWLDARSRGEESR